MFGLSICFIFGCADKQAYAYSPHLSQNVSPGIQGGKEQDWESGKKIVYDIYNSRGWQVVNRDYGKGSQPYLEFHGWSALVGYTHHDQFNQETYIMAENKNTGKQYIYFAEMNGNDASKDLEYNRQDNSNEIVNACPPDAYNKNNDACNMYYHNVGFTAHIPLNDLFPNQTIEDAWQLKIIKKVGDRVVWDDLKVPFEFQDLDFSLGKLSLSSGISAGNLIMGNNGVARRHFPRETGWSGGRYYTVGQTYQRVEQNEDHTVVWYGVSSPEEGGETRWAGSAYWIFGGKPAVLSYKVRQKTCPDGSVVNLNQTCSISVKVKHVDAKTNEILREDQHKVKIGENYRYTPEQKGVFKNKNGNPYVAVPLNQQYTGKAPENNLTFTFTYKASLPNPTKVEELKGSTEGLVKGEFLWELRRIDPSQPSKVYTNSKFNIIGKHYAVRNVTNQVSTKETFSEKSDKPISLLLDIGNVQNKNIEYNYSYEYTNHYSLNYICKDSQGSDCFEWIYKDKKPVWSQEYKKTFDLRKYFGQDLRLLVDSNYGKMFTVPGAKDLQGISKKGASGERGGNLVVGKKKAVDMSKDKNKLVFNKNYYESFKQSSDSKAKDSNSLATQSWVDLSPGTIEYEVELPTDSQKSNSFSYRRLNGESSYYYAVDVDKNLRTVYRNQSPYAYTKYAFPLQIESMSDKGVVDDTKRKYNLNWASDYFFVGKQTGFIQPFAYTKYLKEAEKNQTKIPTADEIKRIAEQEVKANYKKQTGQNFNDTLLHIGSNDKEDLYGSREHLERYYLPIESDSILKTKQQYENKILLTNMGLNDVNLLFGQKFSFDRYLMGSVVDDAFVVEQPDPIVDTSYPHQVTIKGKQQQQINNVTKSRTADTLFGFRKSDVSGLYDQLKKIVNLGL